MFPKNFSPSSQCLIASSSLISYFSRYACTCSNFIKYNTTGSITSLSSYRKFHDFEPNRSESDSWSLFPLWPYSFCALDRGKYLDYNNSLHVKGQIDKFLKIPQLINVTILFIISYLYPIHIPSFQGKYSESYLIISSIMSKYLRYYFIYGNQEERKEGRLQYPHFLRRAKWDLRLQTLIVKTPCMEKVLGEKKKKVGELLYFRRKC